MVVNAARQLSLQDRLPTDVVWENLIDQKWRTSTFDKLSTTHLGILSVAFTRSLRKGGSVWMSGLPHVYALAAQELLHDSEKTKFLFDLTIYSSVQTHTVSAIEMLMRGKRRSLFIEYGLWWKNALGQLSRNAPPWVVARMRAINSAISGSQ
jgi:hypothetical protein